MLEGCWTLGSETQGRLRHGDGRSETCRVEAGRICFGVNGRGTRETSVVCPSSGRFSCQAPIEAGFAGGTMTTKQPGVTCAPGGTTWNPDTLTCRRMGDDLARCTDREGFQHDFRQERRGR
jgi:hypothetical protein